MSNLTLKQGIVKFVSGVDPISDHDLVVFKQVGQGREPYTVVPSGGRFRPGLMDRLAATFFAYAVTRDQDLRYRFTEVFLSSDQVDPFSLDFVLALRVADPLRIVEKLETDPVKRLEDEVKEVLRFAVTRMGRIAIERPVSEVERLALEEEGTDDTGLRMTNLARLRNFAFQLGLDLKGIQFLRYLTEEAVAPEQARIGESRRRRVKEETAKTDFQNLQIVGAFSEYEARRGNAIRDVLRVRELTDAAAKSLERSLNNIADRVDSAPALRSALAEMVHIRSELGQLAEGSTPQLEVAPGALVGSLQSPLLTSEQSPLADLISRMFSLFEGQPLARHRLYSAVLHLLGELVLDGAADEPTLDHYSAVLSQQLQEMLRLKQLGDEQRRFLLHLQDREALKAELA